MYSNIQAVYSALDRRLRMSIWIWVKAVTCFCLLFLLQLCCPHEGALIPAPVSVVLWTTACVSSQHCMVSASSCISDWIVQMAVQEQLEHLLSWTLSAFVGSGMGPRHAVLRYQLPGFLWLVWLNYICLTGCWGTSDSMAWLNYGYVYTVSFRTQFLCHFTKQVFSLGVFTQNLCTLSAVSNALNVAFVSMGMLQTLSRSRPSNINLNKPNVSNSVFHE